MKGFAPEVSVQREILTKLRDEYRNKGYINQVESEALRAQVVPPGQRQALEQKANDLESLSRNCYASARVYQKKLDELPDNKKETEQLTLLES